MTLGLSLNSPSFEVAGRVVVITGAGNGIGAETARQLVARGASVALLDRDEAAVKQLADELGEAAEGIAVDVTRSSRVYARAGWLCCWRCGPRSRSPTRWSCGCRKCARPSSRRANPGRATMTEAAREIPLQTPRSTRFAARAAGLR
ncbi:MAG: SDR family NAD(P)-dependent oxidoreductase [Actinophytocola sp.]|nr:SDR family NAD(P)-dependent oxidoreductase [Actinophytocola sp.]